MEAGLCDFFVPAVYSAITMRFFSPLQVSPQVFLPQKVPQEFFKATIECPYSIIPICPSDFLNSQLSLKKKVYPPPFIVEMDQSGSGEGQRKNHRWRVLFSQLPWSPLAVVYPVTEAVCCQMVAATVLVILRLWQPYFCPSPSYADSPHPARNPAWFS